MSLPAFEKSQNFTYHSQNFSRENSLVSASHDREQAKLQLYSLIQFNLFALPI